MSILFRYLKWDGTQKEFHLETGELFKEFADFLMEGWTPDEALDWIMKQGISTKSFRVMGIDELRSEISRWKDQQLKTHDFKGLLSELQRELSDIVEKELSTLEGKLSAGEDDPANLESRMEFLRNLPLKLSSAVEALADYDFMDDEAKDEFKELLDKLEGIRKLEKFLSRFGERNTGRQRIGFDEAMEIINDFDLLEQFEQSLLSGDFEEISIEELRDLLNEGAINSFILLRQFKSDLESSGYIRIKGTHTELTPKGIRKIGEMALRDVFSSLKRSRIGGHETPERGQGSIKVENTKDYEFGDPFNINVVKTLKNSLQRGSRGNKLELSPEDFEIYESEFHTVSTTALLIDLSWSMSFQGRFPAAKRVAVALDHLIRTRYPRDNFYLIGFSTRARILSADELATTSWDSNDPFTNIQEAVLLASKLVSKHKTPNKQIILITDGQPTAYYVDGYLQVELPMFFGGLSPRATFETLKEVKRCTSMGITINTFMLDDSPTLRRFVDEMTRINRGRAFFTTPQQLGKYLLVDYLNRRKKVI
jgi:uncharacterized protein with von Willebrand factor type A (vWA) domain